MLPQDAGVGDGSLAAAACAGVPHRVQRENIKDLLAKKRETFLVQVGFGVSVFDLIELQLMLATVQEGGVLSRCVAH